MSRVTGGSKRLKKRKATQLVDPVVVLPAGKCLLVTALKSNTGPIYIGSSKKGTKDRNSRMVLNPGEFASINVASSGQIFVAAETDGSQVLYCEPVRIEEL